jgi:hypothetical protein
MTRSAHEPDEKEILEQEIAEGRWDVQSGPPASAGSSERIWNASKGGRKRRMRRMIDLNLARGAGKVGDARREGRDMH